MSKLSRYCCFFLLLLLSFNTYAQSENKQKPVCLIYGNCQLTFVYKYLRANFPNKYEYHHATNFYILEGKAEFPTEIAKKADLFIYQPIQGHGEHDTDFIKTNYLKDSCDLISLPYIYFLGYFPDHTIDPKNIDTIDLEAPCGYFPYGSQKIIDLVSQGYNSAEIIVKSYENDFIPQDEIFEKLNKSLSILRNKEKNTDIKIVDFIEANYQNHRLFLSVNHPSNYLLKELMKQLLTLMKLPTIGIKKNPFFKKEHFAFWTAEIIYPCVANTLHLQFDISHIIFKKEEIFFPLYIVEYINYLYPDSSYKP